MSRWLCVAAVGVLGLCVAPEARAEVGTPPDPAARIFDDSGFTDPAGKGVAAELKTAKKDCDFEEFSREGPSDKELASCERAMAKLIKRGSSAIGPVLAAIDDNDTGWSTRRRLYDVLVRTKDARVIEPLIRGLARIAMRKIDGREWEADVIHEALGNLTRAPVGEQTPWATGPSRSARREQIDRIVDWRLWLEDNRGRSVDALVGQRLAEERAHIDDANVERAYRAVSYLLTREPAEGLAAAKKLADRADLPEDGKREINWRVEQAEEAAREAAPAKRVPMKATKAAPSKKPLPKKPVPSKVPNDSKARS